MEVIKRDGRREKIAYDKITARIEALCKNVEPKLTLDASSITQEVVSGIFSGISTESLDTLTADICASRIQEHPDYNLLAARITVSNLHKKTESRKCIGKVAELLYFHREKCGRKNPLINTRTFEILTQNKDILNKEIDFNRDYLSDFFSIKTLERAYLQRIKNRNPNLMKGVMTLPKESAASRRHEIEVLKKEYNDFLEKGVIIERPQHMWMRVAVGIHGLDIHRVIETYHAMSLGYFTHATPTLFNAGSALGNLSSCFLFGMHDSIEGIFKALGDCAKISQRAGGIGIHLSGIRAAGSLIRSTNGDSNGIIPWCQLLNYTALGVNQGGRRAGSIACFVKDTQIYTSKGVKNIQDVEIGDMVVTHMNRLRQVVQVHKNPLADRKIYKLEVYKTKPIYVTGNHKFWSRMTRNSKGEKTCEGWNSVEDMMKHIKYGETTKTGCYISTPTSTSITSDTKHFISVSDFIDNLHEDGISELVHEKNRVKSLTKCIGSDRQYKCLHSSWINDKWEITEDFANLIGIFLGDGHVKKEDGRCAGIVFTINSNYESEIEFVRKTCINTFGTNVSEHKLKNQNTYTITVNSRMIGVIFKSLFGLFFSGKRLTDEMFSWPKNLVERLVAGLITSDGTLDKGKNSITLSMSNETLMTQIYHLCRANGIIVSLNKKKIAGKGTTNPYIMNILPSLNILKNVYKTYNDDRVERHIENIGRCNDNNYLKVLGITECDLQEEFVYTLGVEEDHSYMVEGLIAENCYLEPWHADIFEFCELRLRTGAELSRARDLFLALWVPDLFMKRVEEDSIWSLFCPDECPGLNTSHGEEFERLYTAFETQRKFKRQVRARELWRHILVSQIETGMPYMAYKDNANNKNNQKNLGTIRSSNLCCEIFEYSDEKEYATCNLASLSLPAFIDYETKTFNYDLLIKASRILTRNLNRVIDVNYYPIPETKVSNDRHRPIGIGVQGLADVFAILKMAFGSPESRELNKKIHETIYYGCLLESVELAKESGRYSTFSGSPFSEGKLQFDLWGLKESDLLMGFDWKSLKQDVMRYGTRNSLLTALMPTASTSQILCNNECFEPFTTNLYTRSTSAGNYTILNRYLVEELLDLGLWDREMREELLYFGGSVQQIDRIPDDIKARYLTAFELSQKAIIDLSIDRGPFIDQSQSLNLFIAEPDFDRLTSCHFHGWRGGLKTGMYYLRTRPAVDPTKFGLEPDTIARIKRKYRVVDSAGLDERSYSVVDSARSSYRACGLDERKRKAEYLEDPLPKRECVGESSCEMCSA